MLAPLSAIPPPKRKMSVKYKAYMLVACSLSLRFSSSRIAGCVLSAMASSVRLQRSNRSDSRLPSQSRQAPFSSKSESKTTQRPPPRSIGSVKPGSRLTPSSAIHENLCEIGIGNGVYPSSSIRAHRVYEFLRWNIRMAFDVMHDAIRGGLTRITWRKLSATTM
jgi:hypothetical protein